MSLVSLPTLYYYCVILLYDQYNGSKFSKDRTSADSKRAYNINNMKYSITLIYNTKYSMAASLAVILLGRFRVALKRAGFWFVEFAW